MLYEMVLRYLRYTTKAFALLVAFTLSSSSLLAQSINIVRYDTICPGETGCHTYMDTLYYEDWESGNSSCWTFDKNNSTYIDGFGISTQIQAKQVPSYRFQAYQGKSLFEVSDKIYNLYGYIVDEQIPAYISNAWGQNMLTYFTSTATSPNFKITNPSQTTVSFYFYDEILGEEGIGFDVDGYPTLNWSEVYWYYNLLNIIDEVALYGSSSTSNLWHLGGVDIDREHENAENYDSWKKATISMSSLSAGNNTLKFYHINHGGLGFGVDNILVYGPRCIEIPVEVSALPAGSHKTTTETVIRYGCTPTTITTHWYVSGQSDTTIVSTTQNPYTWNGSQYTASGIYSKTGFHDKHGCDSTAYLDLTIQSNDTTHIDTTVCNAFYWDANDRNYSTSTHDTLRYSNHWGLDSLIILNLTVNYSTIKQDDTPENKCDSLVWTNIKSGRTFVFHSSGALYDTLSIRNHVNCDSIHESLFIITHSSKADTLTIMSCDTFRWVFNGILYARDTLVSDTLKQGNQDGCDSIATLNLTITNNIIIDSSVIACDSFYWDVTDSTYTLSTTDSLKGKSLDGCDSTLRLLLTIHRHTERHDTLNVCDAHVWQPYAGKHDTITLAGTYFDTLFNGNNVGCDSALILHLTLRHSTQSDTLKQVGCDSSKWVFNDRFYDSTDVYSDTIKNGNHEKCDSIGFLSLTIYSKHPNEIVDTIVCDSFYWELNHRTFTQSITLNERYHYSSNIACDSVIKKIQVAVYKTFYDTILQNACDSFSWHYRYDTILYASGTFQDTLKRQQAKNCDSIRTLQLTINHSRVMPPLTTLECDSMIWDFNHQTYYADTTLIDTIPTREGCDSIGTLRLTIDHSPIKDIAIDSCDRFYWAAKGKTYQESGIYESRIPSAGNCDSIIKLHLTIRKSTDSIWRITACDTFVWQLEQDNVLTMSGVFSNTITNAVGCDSVRTLYLTINHDSPNDTHSVIVCNRYVWPANNTVYYESGIYSAHLRNIAGCDSVSTIRLTVSYNSTNHNEYVACDSIYWEGTDSVYFVSTTDTARLHNQYGCDSLVIQQLNVKHSTYGESQSHTACEQFVWHVSWDKTLKQSGVYHDTIANSVGCDSIIQLRLTIYRNDTVNLYETICDNNPYMMFGQKFVTSGDYPFRSSNRYSCDSILLLHLTVHPTYTIAFSDTAFREDLPYYFDGKYPFDSETRNEPIAFQTADGCDSIYYLTLFITIRQLGCDQRLVFPNVVTPNGDGQNDRFCIVGVDGGCYPTNELFIYNRWGTLVFHRKDISSCADAWEPDYMPAGTYYYRFQASNVYGAIERHGVVEVIKN